MKLVVRTKRDMDIDRDIQIRGGIGVFTDLDKIKRILEHPFRDMAKGAFHIDYKQSNMDGASNEVLDLFNLRPGGAFTQGDPVAYRLEGDAIRERREAEERGLSKPMTPAVAGTGTAGPDFEIEAVKEQPEMPNPEDAKRTVPVDTTPNDGIDDGLDITKLKRERLNALATSIGIEDASSIQNKGLVIKAIEEKEAELKAIEDAKPSPEDGPELDGEVVTGDDVLPDPSLLTEEE